MSAALYISILEDEKKMFKIKDDLLKVAMKDIGAAYSATSLKKGDTFLEYNYPQNRCGYLYKFAALHTDLVAHYFKILACQKIAKMILECKTSLKICCLGGGPGTDIVGIFKILATSAHFHQKVTQVTVLDICGGWRNSFKCIIERLKHGEVDGVPSTFIDSQNFKARLHAVDLLKPLPPATAKMISDADIICMVKFVSAILGKKESANALKNIGNNIKLGAVVLCIDNRDIYKYLDCISQQPGFTTILGPLQEKYKCLSVCSKKDLFAKTPTQKISVSVIGWIKNTANSPTVKNKQISLNLVTENTNDDSSWDTDSSSEESDQLPFQHNTVIKDRTKISTLVDKTCDKATQTDNYLCDTESTMANEIDISNLTILIDTLTDLFTRFKVLREKHNMSQNCCPD